MRRLLIILLASLFLVTASWAGTGQSADITAQNTFTSSLDIFATKRMSISISGTFVATVTLQRKCDGVNWRDVEAWSGVVEATYVGDERCDLRIGIKSGDFTSGTAVVRIGLG